VDPLAAIHEEVEDLRPTDVVAIVVPNRGSLAFHPFVSEANSLPEEDVFLEEEDHPDIHSSFLDPY
jgi:hypothetical protein